MPTVTFDKNNNVLIDGNPVETLFGKQVETAPTIPSPPPEELQPGANLQQYKDYFMKKYGEQSQSALHMQGKIDRMGKDHIFLPDPKDHWHFLSTMDAFENHR